MYHDSVAERYAQALFEAAKDIGMVKQWEEKLRIILLTIKNDRFLSRALFTPKIPSDVKKDMLKRVFSSEISTPLRNFLYILIDKGRENYLKDIFDCYVDKVLDLDRAMTAKVVVAVPLSPETEVKVADALSRYSGLKIKLEVSIDPDIIGGIIVRMGGKIMDWSISGQLSQLRERMLNVSRIK